MVSNVETRRRANRRNSKLNADNEITGPVGKAKTVSSATSTVAPAARIYNNAPISTASTSNTNTKTGMAINFAVLTLPGGHVTSPSVLRLSKVDVLFSIMRAPEDGNVVPTATKIVSVPADKLFCASRTFERHLTTQPQMGQYTTYQELVSEPGIGQGAISHFMSWLASVKCPFPSSYHGKKQVAVPCDNIVLATDTLMLAFWLELKAPFAVNMLVNHIWAYFKDETKPVPPGAVLSLWSTRPALDPKLQRHALYRAVQWVKELDNFSADDKEYQSFLSVFRSSPALARAFQESFKHHRESGEGETKVRKLDYRVRTTRTQHSVDTQVMWKVLNQRGVGSISAEEAERFTMSS